MIKLKENKTKIHGPILVKYHLIIKFKHIIKLHKTVNKKDPKARYSISNYTQARQKELKLVIQVHY